MTLLMTGEAKLKLACGGKANAVAESKLALSAQAKDTMACFLNQKIKDLQLKLSDLLQYLQSCPSEENVLRGFSLEDAFHQMNSEVCCSSKLRRMK